MTSDASATTRDEPARAIALEGAFNLRDLGGYRTRDGATTRWRRVLRADGPERLTERDRTTLLQLGVGTVIDLRNGGEGGPGVWPTVSGGEYHRLPLFDIVPDERPMDPVVTAQDLGLRYLYRLETAGPQLSRALTLIAERLDRPTLFHCAAGKDRTGILAAALLQVLGVDDETIIEDYAITDAAHRRKIQTVLANPMPFDVDYDSFPAILKGAHPDVMATFLRFAAERHGSVAQFLETEGLSTSDVVRLRAGLLE
jgi:protein-tyrosine phosphatase